MIQVYQVIKSHHFRQNRCFRTIGATRLPKAPILAAKTISSLKQPNATALENFRVGFGLLFFFGYKKPEVLTRFNPEKGILKHYQKEAGSISSMAFKGFHLLLNLGNVKNVKKD